MEEGQLASDAQRHPNECIMIFRCKDGRVRSMTEFMDSESARRVFEAGGGVVRKLVTQTYDEVE
jgi:ketosteroid isomerase-like protein